MYLEQLRIRFRLPLAQIHAWVGLIGNSSHILSDSQPELWSWYRGFHVFGIQ
jgi:hypothetical protein